MEEIINIEDIKVNVALPKEIRIKQFVEKVRNPYRFMVDDIIVNGEIACNIVSKTCGLFKGVFSLHSIFYEPHF